VARILIVDDDPDQLKIYPELLETAGHEVQIAWGAAQVVQRAPWADLIMMDLRIPEASDGMALIRRIRESRYTRPVIVVSGWPDEIYGQPEEQMVSRVMVKPVMIAVLFETIAELTA
jgi:CheY-like chemotaxis protein